MNTNTVKLASVFNSAKLSIKRLVSLTSEVAALGGNSKLGGSKSIKLTTDVGEVHEVALQLLRKRGAAINDDSVLTTEAQLKAGIQVQRTLDAMAKTLGLSFEDIIAVSDVFSSMEKEAEGAKEGPVTTHAKPAKAEKAKSEEPAKKAA